MRNDISYCLNEDTCERRRECARWLRNYSNEEIKKLYTENRFVNEVIDSDCIESKHKLFKKDNRND